VIEMFSGFIGFIAGVICGAIAMFILKGKITAWVQGWFK